jgi:predicted AAA+ superfamily ATPase
MEHIPRGCSVFNRILNIKLPVGKSTFLWGARKTGKSTWLKTKFQGSTTIDFLQSDVFYDYMRRPALLRERILADFDSAAFRQPVVLDEVQKVPQLLDEVHWLIENRKISFILCGSSARKLKHGHANLLGGRAWRFVLHPLISAEIPQFDLLRALNNGLIPDHYLEEDAGRSQKSYVIDYLKEEIMAEGLTRNIPAFSRFTDMLGFTSGEMINFANIGRDCGIDSKTVREYFQIIFDTNLGYFLEPYSGRRKRNIISQIPKFYLFDTGIANFLSGRRITIERGPEFGRSLEHLIFLELIAFKEYKEYNGPIRYWRTPQGQEVDFVIGDGDIAIEVKGSSRVDTADLSSLHAYMD